MTTTETTQWNHIPVEERVRQALEGRQTRPELRGLGCYRLIHADGDGLPHVTVDRFESVILVEQHREDLNLEPLLNALSTRLGAPTPIFVKERWRYGGSDCQARQVAGDPAPTSLTVSEGDLRFQIDLSGLEHVGLFLDGRPLRQYLRAHSADKRMLNLFSYTGAFGIAAAAGGARATTNLDNKRSALDKARANYQLNELPFNSRTFMKDDIFRYLKRGAKGSGRYDVIVLDPPPRFRRGGKSFFQAATDYPELVARTLELLAPGGTLIAGLNALSVADDAFEEIVAQGAQAAGVALEIEQILRAGADFPPSTTRPVARFAVANRPA